ncbi:hypothetical protein R3P38DRAFT_2792437 [Favolaschia claudopus]|uniref:Uncharacterized protein n=1 Tax=Favolaschia claudopus TaxID=2862362 RepID=A0AAW0AF57_9AGAR
MGSFPPNTCEDLQDARNLMSTFLGIIKKSVPYLGTPFSTSFSLAGSPTARDGTSPSVTVRQMSTLKPRTDGVRQPVPSHNNIELPTINARAVTWVPFSFKRDRRMYEQWDAHLVKTLLAESASGRVGGLA